MELDALLRDLLDGGVAPRYVSRLAAELEDHRADLEQEALARAATAAEASAEARERLGDYTTIAAEFARHGELRSWVYDSPWLVSALRLLARTTVASSRCLRAAGAAFNILARYATAGAAAAFLTLALLWAMQSAVRGGPPRSGERQTRDSVPDLRRALPLLGSTRVSMDGASYAFVPRESVKNVPGRERTAVHARMRRSKPVPVADLRPRVPPIPRPTVPRAPPRPVATLASASFEPRSGFSDGDIVPIARPRPAYPTLAARRGIEGYVVLEYTVTRAGTVEEVAVVESSNSLFNRSALEAVNKFRYKPRIVDGHPVAVQGVRTKIRFELEA
jgi:protein TonB